MADPVTAGIAGGATLLSGAMGSSGARDASRVQGRSAQAGIAEQRAGRESFEERTEPFRQVGLSAAIPILQQLGITPSDELLNTAGIDRRSLIDQGTGEVGSLANFLRQEGFEDIQETAAAQGRLRSGGTLEDLTQFNTELAGTLENQRFNQLFNLLGLGSNVAAGQGTAGLQTSSNIANLLGNQGAAQAAGIAGSAQAQQNVLGDLGLLLGYGAGGGFGGAQRPNVATGQGFTPLPQIQPYYSGL